MPGQTIGIQDLIQEIVKCVPIQPATPSGPFKFAIDHCFAIRGQGTVLTGTALSGTAKVGDTIELPELKVNNLTLMSHLMPHGIKRGTAEVTVAHLWDQYHGSLRQLTAGAKASVCLYDCKALPNDI